MARLSIDIWSDIACPWCYVGKRRLERALHAFPERQQVAVTWHSFELDPSAPRMVEPSLTYTERLARKYGTSREQAQGMIDRMVAVGAEDRISFDFSRIRPGNTFDAHRVLHMAKERDLADAAKERLLRAYQCEGEAIGDRNVLVRLATEIGLDVDETASMLASDDFASAVREDEERARSLGVTGVPFFVFAQKYAVSGAQPSELFEQILAKAWAEVPSASAVDGGPVCGPDGC